MSKQTEIICSIIQAPNGFHIRNTPSLGLEGTIDAFYNGILIIKTRLGEIILKILVGEHLQAGTKIIINHEKNSEIVRISATNRATNRSLNSPSNIKDEPPVRPIGTSIYSPKNSQYNEIKGHHTAAEATLESAISSATKDDAFEVARSICLIPDIGRDRGMISIMTFLLVSLSRGRTNTWTGGSAANSEETPWDHVLMERTIEGPDGKKWKTRQFPINLHDDTVWAIFATPAEMNSPVSRFIVEVPTRTFGLVQVKAFGQSENCEIIITSNIAFNDTIKALCRSAITEVAEEIDAEIKVSFVSDPMMLANLSQARRTSFEA